MTFLGGKCGKKEERCQRSVKVSEYQPDARKTNSEDEPIGNRQ